MGGWNPPGKRASGDLCGGSLLSRATLGRGADRGAPATVGDGWTGIGNANPESLISWEYLFTAYGRWAEPAEPGEIDDVPPHNSACKRGVLLECGPELETVLEVETNLHWELRARGHRLYLEPAARTHHVDFMLLSPFVRAEFHYGRLFAAARSARWPILWRFMYTCGGPLIPLVRLLRVLSGTAPGRCFAWRSVNDPEPGEVQWDSNSLSSRLSFLPTTVQRTWQPASSRSFGWTIPPTASR